MSKVFVISGTYHSVVVAFTDKALADTFAANNFADASVTEVDVLTEMPHKTMWYTVVIDPNGVVTHQWSHAEWEFLMQEPLVRGNLEQGISATSRLSFDAALQTARARLTALRAGAE